MESDSHFLQRTLENICGQGKCLCRFFCTVTQKYLFLEQKPSDGLKVLIIPKRDTSTFLSAIPDDTPLSSVLLPGE